MRTLLFSYNGLAQLTSEKGQESNIYAYDSLDNRRSINEDELIYGALNQLKSHGNVQFSYDSQGNLSNRKNNQYNRKVESNILSEVVQITKADKKKLYCTYDPFGRRLKKSYFDPKGKKIVSTDRYLYLGDQEVGTIDEKDIILQLRIPGVSGESLSLKSVAIELNDKFYAPIHGIDGNLIALVDPISSTVVESYSYSAFGIETIYDSSGTEVKESSLGNPWRYAEKRTDQETGMVFFGRRYYDPQMGRWISPDPLGTSDGPNAYAYLHNNPKNYCDRFGLTTEDNSSIKYHHFFYGECVYYCNCQNLPYRVCPHGPDRDREKANQLPKITYNDTFENIFHPYYERSKIFDLNLPEFPDFRIGYINGVNNNSEEAYETVEYISRLAYGYNVHGVYNATHGADIDFYECAIGLNYIATEPVRQLHKMWNNFFDQASSEATFLMICHSQGAIHVRNALLDYPEDLRNRIVVAAFAPGAYIYQQSCAKVTHYRVSASRDIVPRIDQAGANRSKGTIEELQSDTTAPWMDHTILSSTYKKPLFVRIREYMKSGGLK